MKQKIDPSSEAHSDRTLALDLIRNTRIQSHACRAGIQDGIVLDQFRHQGGVASGPDNAKVGQHCKPQLLDPIPELTLNHDSHRYSYKGQLLARSVSEVIGHDLTPEQRAGMERYKHGPDGWAARGTAIHKVLEHHLKGEPCVMDDKWSPWVDALLDESIFGRFRLLACEFLLVDERRSMGGSFDFLIELEELGVPEGKGLIVLGDLKTVSHKTGVGRRKPATAQLGAYLSMLKRLRPKVQVSQCVTVVSGPERCKVIREDPEDCHAAWEEAWSRYNLDLPEF